jgi:hypothetical protein
MKKTNMKAAPIGESNNPGRGLEVSVAKPVSDLLFDFERAGNRYRCELHDYESRGVEVRLFLNTRFYASWRFDDRSDSTRTPREQAIAWAREERKLIERSAAEV